MLSALAARAQDEDASSTVEPSITAEPLPSLLKRAKARSGSTSYSSGEEAGAFYEQLSAAAYRISLDDVGLELVAPIVGSCQGIAGEEGSCDEFTDRDLARSRTARLKEVSSQLFVVSVSQSWSVDAGAILLPYDFHSKRFGVRSRRTLHRRS